MYIDEEDFLEHFGVRGMKWGVRRDRRANTHVKVGQGKGTVGERVRSAATLGPVDFVKGRGFKGGAARRGARQLARNQRVREGEASVKDKLVYYGGWKYQDVFPTGKTSTNTKAAIGASVVGAILVGQVVNLALQPAAKRYVEKNM